MNKTLKPVDKPPEVPKPTWNAKTLEKPATVWKPAQIETTNGNRVCMNVDKPAAIWKPAQIEKHTVNGNCVSMNLDKPGTVKKPAQIETAAVNGNRITMNVTDWRSKYDEAEKRRKELLGENQKGLLWLRTPQFH